MTGKAYITNLAAFLPNAPVGNDAMEAVLGMINGQPSRARRIILRSNGIQTRHYVIDPATGQPTHTNAQLTAAAIRGLENGRFRVEQTELLACGTTFADQLVPGHASMVHGELGIPPCETVSTSGVCISSTTAMKYAMLGVAGGEFSHAVSAGSETPSVVMHARNFQGECDAQIEALEHNGVMAFQKDFIRWMLSDGAGAALIEPEPAPEGLSLRLEWIVERSYAHEQPACMYGGADKLADGRLKGWPAFEPHEWTERSVFTLKQDVKQLNEHVMHYTVERPLRELAQFKQLRPGDIDWFLPHYSSHYFRERVREHMLKADFDISFERWFTNLYTKGNTGAASIYIMLEELLHSDRLKAGQRLLCYVPESGRFSTAWIHATVVGPDGQP
ncbi:MAG TPA: beta-ketoacyl-ACP synthase III [Gammaproteobacteria bacterium]|jgi:3-oxoacyl-[acyl-carrier-protein] synthase-3|nr:beta-ketoacyl-ACP synthase III [Gammaproteobacteria bacterium]